MLPAIMKTIRSRENTQYRELLQLARSARARRLTRTILLDGVHLIQTYIRRFTAHGLRLFVQESKHQSPEIAALIEHGQDTLLLDDRLFERVALVQSPAGILGVALQPEIASPARQNPFQVAIEAVQDPGNLGAILRSAAAAGASAAHLSSDCADPWSPKALRGGMGAQFVIPTHQHADLISAAAALGVRLVACTADAQDSLFDVDLTGSVCFIIGAEGAGISQKVRERAHQLLRVPMSDGIESLNAAAAASVIFYERFRQTRVDSQHEVE
jgi:TrmH family RNA methyltransferase